MKTKPNLLILAFLALSVVGFLGFLAVLIFELNYFFSILCFMVIPSLVLRFTLFKIGSFDKDIIQFSAIMLLFGIPYTYLAHLNQVWFETTMFPFRIINFPLESFLFVFFYSYMTLAFYRCFLEPAPPHQPSLNWQKLTRFGIIFCIALLLLEYVELTQFPLFYFWAALLTLALSAFLAIKTDLRRVYRICLVSLGAVGPFICFEYTALKFENWSFPPGNHIGYLPFFNYVIPLEELMFALLTPICLLLTFIYFYRPKRS